LENTGMTNKKEPSLEIDGQGDIRVMPKEYRHPCGKRFDLLDPAWLEGCAKIMAVGAQKYGEEKWKQGLTGEHSGANHALAHIMEFLQKVPNDYGPLEMHWAQVSVNAMFEFHFARQERLRREADSLVTEEGQSFGDTLERANG
jgi:hypothetical protein